RRVWVLGPDRCGCAARCRRSWVDLLCREVFPQAGKTAGGRAFHGPGGDAELVGALLLREVAVVAEYHDRPLSLGQRPQPSYQPILLAGDVGVVRGMRQQITDLGLRIDPAPPLAPPVL